MILVDTSVWIDHLRAGEPLLAEMLNTGSVLTHPFVIGELACGNLRDRQTLLSLLRKLPLAAAANDEEMLFFIEEHRLMGRGIGYIDAHLLAAVSLAGTALLWTRDKPLGAVSRSMKLAYGTA
ncbi:type II toxin-antitoxin system VapC family toxin [soil metagenome]